MVNVEITVRIPSGVVTTQDALESIPAKYAEPQSKWDVPSLIANTICRP
jgi:hypothetical protein